MQGQVKLAAESSQATRGGKVVEKLFTPEDGVLESSVVLSDFRDGIVLPQRKPAAASVRSRRRNGLMSWASGSDSAVIVAIAALTISVASLALQILR
ncbi:MAG: hypothetical protein JWL84_4611 [Rhodospirillales bacterium]|nr:hypothetical protein [Rhodospirillales bacterium]